MLAESSTRRGAGLAVKARCPLHFNVTAALLDTLGDMQQQIIRIHDKLDADNFRRRVEAVRTAQTAPGENGVDSLAGRSAPAAPAAAAAQAGERKAGGGGGEDEGEANWAECETSGQEDDIVTRYRHREVFKYQDVFRVTWPVDEPGLGLGGRDTPSSVDGCGDGGRGASSLVGTARFPVCHEFSAPLPPESRMSFTILNLTGQRTRYFQPRAGEETRRLQYLRVRIRGRISVLPTVGNDVYFFPLLLGGENLSVLPTAGEWRLFYVAQEGQCDVLGGIYPSTLLRIQARREKKGVTKHRECFRFA